MTNQEYSCVYLKLHPRFHEFDETIRTLEELLSLHPGADAKIVGMSHDSHVANVFVGVTCPISDKDPAGISGLRFLAAVFETMFDVLPAYSSMPNALEEAAAARWLANRPIQHAPTPVRAAVSLASSSAPATTIGV